MRPEPMTAILIGSTFPEDALAKRQHELEAGAVRMARRVDELAAERVSVEPRDREAEAGAALARRSALEALEEVLLEVRRHARAAVLDDEAEVAVVRVRLEAHR